MTRTSSGVPESPMNFSLGRDPTLPRRGRRFVARRRVSLLFTREPAAGGGGYNAAVS